MPRAGRPSWSSSAHIIRCMEAGCTRGQAVVTSPTDRIKGAPGTVLLAYSALARGERLGSNCGPLPLRERGMLAYRSSPARSFFSPTYTGLSYLTKDGTEPRYIIRRLLFRLCPL